MRVVLILIAAGLMTGCLPGIRKAKVKPPPPPKPAPASTGSVNTADAQLSIPQTTAQLPPPQPVNPAALAPPPETPPQEEPAQPQTAPKPRKPAAASAAKPEPVLTAPLPAAPSSEERPRIQPIVPPDERKRIQAAIDARTNEVNERLKQAEKRGLSQQEQAIVSRIKSFLSLSDEAGKEGKLSQADSLSERALILARELQIER